MIRSIRIFFALLVMWVAALTLQGQSSSNLSIAISTIEQARGLARYPDSSLAVLQGLDARSLDDSLKVEYHKTKGMAFFYKGILDSSIAAYSTAMALVDTSRCTDQSAVVTNGLAVVLHAAGLKGEAINYYSKALGCAEFRGDDPLKLKIYNNLSILNRELGRYQWAQRYLDKAFELTDPGNTAAWASLYNSRGQNFLLVQKYDSAQVNFLRSDEFRHE